MRHGEVDLEVSEHCTHTHTNNQPEWSYYRLHGKNKQISRVILSSFQVISHYP